MRTGHRQRATRSTAAAAAAWRRLAAALLTEWRRRAGGLAAQPAAVAGGASLPWPRTATGAPDPAPPSAREALTLLAGLRRMRMRLPAPAAAALLDAATGAMEALARPLARPAAQLLSPGSRPGGRPGPRPPARAALEALTHAAQLASTVAEAGVPCPQRCGAGGTGAEVCVAEAQERCAVALSRLVAAALSVATQPLPDSRRQPALLAAAAAGPCAAPAAAAVGLLADMAASRASAPWLYAPLLVGAGREGACTAELGRECTA